MSGERGSATAEFAVALPVVVLVLACCLSGMAVMGQQLRLQDAAALAARALARGGDPETLVARLSTGAQLARNADGDLACVTLTMPAHGPLPLTLTARSCALDGGR
jgi:Flp pilus assembly protein TadG